MISWSGMFQCLKQFSPQIFLMGEKSKKAVVIVLFINWFVIDNNFHNLSCLDHLSNQNAQCSLDPASQMIK